MGVECYDVSMLIVANGLDVAKWLGLHGGIMRENCFQMLLCAGVWQQGTGGMGIRRKILVCISWKIQLHHRRNFPFVQVLRDHVEAQAAIIPFPLPIEKEMRQGFIFCNISIVLWSAWGGFFTYFLFPSPLPLSFATCLVCWWSDHSDLHQLSFSMC